METSSVKMELTFLISFFEAGVMILVLCAGVCLSLSMHSVGSYFTEEDSSNSTKANKCKPEERFSMNANILPHGANHIHILKRVGRIIKVSIGPKCTLHEQNVCS